MHCLSSLYIVHLSVDLVGLEANQDNRQSTKENNKYKLLYPYGVPPNDGL